VYTFAHGAAPSRVHFSHFGLYVKVNASHLADFPIT
jgi:hypothetical protein